MSRYSILINKPCMAKQEDSLVDSSVVYFNLVSCTYDNEYKLTVRRTADDMASVSLGKFSLNNLKMDKNSKEEIRWAFLGNDLQAMIDIINTGTSKVESYEIKMMPKPVVKNEDFVIMETHQSKPHPQAMSSNYTYQVVMLFTNEDAANKEFKKSKYEWRGNGTGSVSWKVIPRSEVPDGTEYNC